MTAETANGGNREGTIWGGADRGLGGHEAWASGVGAVRRFWAPVELPGWGERPWVEVRPLTEAEALEQESLGLIEEYELVQRGLGEPELRVRRVYDLVAMAEYEWGKCLVDWCLPEWKAPGTEVPVWGGASLRDAGTGETAGAELVARRKTAGDEEGDRGFLREMRPCLAAWVREVLDLVNWRLPEQRAQIEAAKKN